jgi:heat-inducible transcriptional repressor
MLEDRRLDVLRAIVEGFVLTNEPVGSRAVAERRQLGVSPATVRNDMAALEEEGYIVQPHTSAGRVPTDKGYRLFVDKLSSVKPMSVAERRAIETFLEGAVDLDDVVRRSVRLLAQLTRQVAVVQYPTLSRAEVRHVEVVAMTSTRLLLVLITDRGRVEQRVVELPEPQSDDDIADLRRVLGQALHGCRLVDVPAAVSELPDTCPPHLRPTLSMLVAVILESLVERPEERVVLAGTANLTRSTLDFPHTLRPVLEALEEQVVLLRLLGSAHQADQVTVTIGAENDVEGLQTTSVVSADYGFGGVGVVGPTRMDYAANMGAVRAVARYVGELLGS